MTHDPLHETPDQHDRPDEWHDHAADVAPQAAHAERVNAPLVILIGVALFVAVIVTVIIVYQFYNWYSIRMVNSLEFDPERRAAVEVEALDNKATALSLLESGGAWVDHNTIQTPIDDAMADVIRTYATARRR